MLPDQDEHQNRKAIKVTQRTHKHARCVAYTQQRANDEQPWISLISSESMK